MGRNGNTFDWVTFLPLLLLCGCGLIGVGSTNPTLLSSQAVFVGIGLILFFIIRSIDYRIFEHFASLLYVISCILLLVTFVGPEIRGSTQWIMLGGFQLQTSEIVKPLLLISFASFLSKRSPEKLGNFFLMTVLFLIPAAMVFKQPDLGNTLVYISFFVGMVIIAGLKPLVMIILSTLFTVSLPISFQFLKEYQKLRIVTFLTPSHDPQGAGYNALQAMIAVGSGKLFGRGFGRGVQSHLRFLPENHTDFIFASFVEEFGMVGGLLLLGTYFLLLWQILQTARTSRSSFVAIFCIGLFMQLFVQIVINIGMNMGVLPITGITLPLVSYGGSSILATFITLGIFASMRKVTHSEFTLANPGVFKL